METRYMLPSRMRGALLSPKLSYFLDISLERTLFI